MPDRRLDASALLDWADAAVAGLLIHAEEINRLNVFPVADCDTGTNMVFTMRTALAAARPAAGSGDVTRVAAALSDGAAHGARGNSGVILSQILKALADVTADAARDTDLADVDARLLGAVLRHGFVLVVAAMGGPMVEGTVASVLQATAEVVEQQAADGAGLGSVLGAASHAAATALERTTAQLDVLARAGVVDAGGLGFLILLDALTATITGREPHRPAYRPAAAAPDTPEIPGPEFEVMYLLSGCDAGCVSNVRSALESLGDSVAIAPSTADRYSVHVHTDDAGAAIEAGLASGRVSRIRISALATGRVSPGGWSRDRAVLAVVDGDGAADLFRTEGAYVLRPDAELIDPANGVSADELLRALVDTGAAQVMVLPNGYVAAEDLVAGCATGIGWGIDVVPLPAASMAQGLAALAVHDPDRQAVDDGYAMARAAAGARHGSVRVATETALTWAGTCQPGDGLGIVGDEVVVVASDLRVAATKLIDLLLGSGGELVTVLIGAGLIGAGLMGADLDTAAAEVGDVLAEHVHRRHPGAEFVSYCTGHRGDVLLIGVE
ncbi:MAG: DAK2 domain-containing protein [Mycobacterium sp.]|nr:DAK2 domain-containing protein [Mycobacterium sp.]